MSIGPVGNFYSNDKLPNILRDLFKALVGTLTVCFLTNCYSFWNRSFFRSEFSILINTAAPLLTLLYLILAIYNKKKLRKRLHEQYEKFFNKN